jgi:polyphosphate kinase
MISSCTPAPGSRTGALCALPIPALKDVPFVPRTLWNLPPRGRPFDDIRYARTTRTTRSRRSRRLSARPSRRRDQGHATDRPGLPSSSADRGAEAGSRWPPRELKARFDERNNINWATRLESAGVHVVYGVENLKTHCKLCLIVRKESDGVRRYVHVGTGNYNHATAQIYTDMGLFTANPEICDDASDLFNYLTGYSKRREYRQLLVAPVSLRAAFLALVDREIDHAAAHVIIKKTR